MKTYEVNFDGLVGPTHNYAGLSFGNLASTKNKTAIASPKKAALEGLSKMKALMDMGLKQAVLPPHERPYVSYLRKLGFTGRADTDVLNSASKAQPELFKTLCSASSMWVANAATVSPFLDTEDGRTHFTPANLSSMFHRSIEHEQTARSLKAIFTSESDYVHHKALPGGSTFSDEGAANHTRFFAEEGGAGVELFVYGASIFHPDMASPKHYPARQTLQASECIARHHGLNAARAIFAQQNPDAIDAGVFHNDVISVGSGDVFFYHQDAFLNLEALRKNLDKAMGELGGQLQYIEVPREKVSLNDAVRSYLFNTQLVAVPGQNTYNIIAPTECRHLPAVYEYLEGLKAQHSTISEIHYFDLRQSMSNGGGPACLRLRVVMSDQQINDLGARVMLNEELYTDLVSWVKKHYRNELSGEDLNDPNLLIESRNALDELTQILNLGSIYEFQGASNI